MTVSPILDSAGRRRSPATMPGYHAGRPPRNKGWRYPADPPTVEEIIAVMRQSGDDRHGFRLRALIIVLWRGGLRVQEALSLGERDLDPPSTARPAGGPGRAPTSASNSAGSPPTRYALRSGRLRRPPLRAHRVSTASANPRVARSTAESQPSCHITRISNTRTSAPPASTRRASTPRRSSPPSTPGARR